MGILDSTTKCCTRCGTDYPLTAENFRLDGKWFENVCRVCQREVHNARRRTPETKLQHRVDAEGFKICPKCGIRKPATTEYFHRKGDRFTSYCRECRNAHSAIYGREHAAEKALYARQWNASHRGHLRELERQRYKKNPRAGIERTLRYKKQHPEQNRLAANHRRARELQAEGTHTADDVALQMKSQRSKCWWCGIAVGDTYHVDHVRPLARGGSNGPENIVISCPHCNLSKGAKLPQEWNGRLL